MENKPMERKSLFPKKNSGPRSETFAIRVASYDTAKLPHSVKGTRIDNDESVVVYLRDVEYKQSGRFTRAEIKNFAEPRKDRQHPGTALGGTLLIQDAMIQPNGTFGARWIQSLSHTEGEAEVFVATVHVTPVKRGVGNKAYSLMTVLHDGDFGHLSQDMGDTMKLTPPFKVDTVDELKDAVRQLLDDGIGVGVRVSNSESYDALYVATKKDMTVIQAVDNFMLGIKELAESINSGDLTCEVVPYGNLWAGPATTDIMSKNKVVQSRLARFNEPAINRNGDPYTISVFRPAIVAARMTAADDKGKRSVYFSHFEPLFHRQPVFGLVDAIAHAQTEHLAPEPAKQTQSEAHSPTGDVSQPNPAGANGADNTSAGFDGGNIVDDDLMGAVHGDPDDIGDDFQPPAQEQTQQAPAPRRYAGRRG